MNSHSFSDIPAKVFQTYNKQQFSTVIQGKLLHHVLEFHNIKMIAMHRKRKNKL